jgi:hypothetical protein
MACSNYNAVYNLHGLCLGRTRSIEAAINAARIAAKLLVIAFDLAVAVEAYLAG